MDPRTNEEFVASGGLCPFCGSDEVEGDSFDVEGDIVHQESCCNACDSEWSAGYKLHDYVTVNNTQEKE